MRNLLLEEAADLLEALLLRLPRWSRRRRRRRRRHRHRNPPPRELSSIAERGVFGIFVCATERESEKENNTAFK